jgi:hypothetical protein
MGASLQVTQIVKTLKAENEDLLFENDNLEADVCCLLYACCCALLRYMLHAALGML